MNKQKPNIIIVLADQLRQSSVNCYGIENTYTPNINKFAETATMFTRAISNTPICSPARATLLSGLHAISHSVVLNEIIMPTEIKSIAHCMNEEGYRCGYIGKWHLDDQDRGAFIPPGPRRQGFDDFWAAYNCNHSYFSAYYYLNDHTEPIWVSGYEPFKQTELAVQYIEEKSNNQEPFLLCISYGTPHEPYDQVPQKYKGMYPTEKLNLKENVFGRVDRKNISGYYAHITALDECFGVILDAVEKAGIRKNSIILFTSDHGDMLYSHGATGKLTPWLESVNIPMLISWPGVVPQNRISGSPISLVDVMPTLLGLSGVKIPEETQGVNLADMVLGDDSKGQDSVYINAMIVPRVRNIFAEREWRGIVTARYTYAEYDDNAWVLYDDISDPCQLNNLVDNKSYCDIMKMMQLKLRNWREHLQDPFNKPEKIVKQYKSGLFNNRYGTIYYENDIIREGKAKYR